MVFLPREWEVATTFACAWSRTTWNVLLCLSFPHNDNADRILPKKTPKIAAGKRNFAHKGMSNKKLTMVKGAKATNEPRKR